MSRHADPLVQAFLDSDPDSRVLVEGLRRLGTPQHPKAVAVVRLFEASVGLCPTADALAAAERSTQLRSNVDLHVLFLLAWSRCLIYQKSEWEQLKVLVARARRLVNGKTPPELRAWVAVQWLYVATIEGELLRREAFMQEVLAVPRDSPHFPRLAQCCAMPMLQLGMGTQVSDEAVPPLADGAMLTERLMILRFIDAVQTGSVERAWALLGRAEASSALAQAGVPYFAVARHTLRLMCQGAGTRVHAQARALLDDDASSLPDWVISTQHLLGRRADDALRWARADAARDIWAGRTHFLFDAYTLIRAELAIGNADAARRLLQDRHDRGCQHYIDALFWWRIELLAGQHEQAASQFQLLKQGIERFDAQGRLEFELTLALEMSPLDLLRAGPFTDLPRQRAAGTSPSQSSESASRVGSTPITDPIERMMRDWTGTRGEPKPRLRLGELVYASPAMARIVELLPGLARHDVPVLISGETGTGKEVVARALHELGPRVSEPFVAINCTALSDSLIESELFGHRKGAFTGADQAYGGLFLESGRGTLFLDEIGHISPKLQAALLRVLESGEIRPVGSSKRHKIACRLIAATNADLHQRVALGQFRQDLLFRLKRLVVHLPPLRERAEDVLALARHFLNVGRPSGVEATLSGETARMLQAYHWPGNVRELNNLIERMRLLNSDKLAYTADDLKMQGMIPGTDLARSGDQPKSPPAGPYPQAGLPSRSPGSSLTEPGRAGAATSPAPGQAVDSWLAAGRSKLRRLERLRTAFETHHKLKVCEVIGLLGISRSTASRYLAELEKHGVITRVEPSAATSTHYFELTPAEDSR